MPLRGFALPSLVCPKRSKQSIRDSQEDKHESGVKTTCLQRIGSSNGPCRLHVTMIVADHVDLYSCRMLYDNDKLYVYLSPSSLCKKEFFGTYIPHHLTMRCFDRERNRWWDMLRLGHAGRIHIGENEGTNAASSLLPPPPSSTEQPWSAAIGRPFRTPRSLNCRST